MSGKKRRKEETWKENKQFGCRCEAATRLTRKAFYSLELIVLNHFTVTQFQERKRGRKERRKKGRKEER